MPAYLGVNPNAWLYQKDVLAKFGCRPRQSLLEFRGQVPDLTGEQIYPVEALSIMGSEEFIKAVSSEGELRRGRPRAYPGPKLTLQKLSEILCQGTGLSPEDLSFREKGTRRSSAVRGQLIRLATRVMFYPATEVVHFLRITASAVTHANHRFDSRLGRNPYLKDELVSLLMGKS